MVADEQLKALPLPMDDWVELPPLPPVAALVAPPELPALAVQELLPPLPLEVHEALPSLDAEATLKAPPPLEAFSCDCSNSLCELLLLVASDEESADESPDESPEVLLLDELPLPDAD
ncbi:MAG: hypothetical protein JF887_08105 [Candidatus Dormibacteraeota bacterium]|uniref:Uncharacterized protein n=1 Tax=Candidatus Amunia macphersoniae TaxID=3127014 RepID=A0A934NG27_9BACT|nr:hypothetical protein [Candidatus Dormibacteraeota bacterium]